MTTQKFSKSEAIKFGWEVMKNNLGFFIALLIVTVLISLIPDAIAGFLRSKIPAISFVITIASWVLSVIILLGIIKITLRFCDNEKGEFTDLFSCYHLFFKYLGGFILYMLIVIGGTILLVVPGIIWGIKFWFFDYCIVDENLGPIESLNRSAAITAGVKMDLFLFGILCMLINLLGAACLLLGLFVTIPTTMVAIAFVYRKLQTQIGSVQDSAMTSQEEMEHMT